MLKTQRTYDLIYAGEHQREIKDKIHSAFPNALIKDASDFIHRGRFEVEIDNMRTDKFLIWLCAQGWAFLSISIQLIEIEEPARCLHILKAAVRLQNMWESGHANP